MIGHENDAPQGEGADAQSGGSVAEPDPSAVAESQDTSDAERQYTPEPVSRKPLGCLIEIAETLILTIVIFWLIQTFVAQPYRVEQQSMHGTLEEGQYVLVDKLTPKWDSYSRGDIVVLNPVIREGSCAGPISQIEGEDNTPFIKRVIGEPGDLVELRGGDVYINGALVDEPYVHGEVTQSLNGERSWTIAAGQVFVMGDNRVQSSDSRAFGPICESDVIGRAVVRYWPINTLSILQTPTYPNVPPAQAATSALP